VRMLRLLCLVALGALAACPVHDEEKGTPPPPVSAADSARMGGGSQLVADARPLPGSAACKDSVAPAIPAAQRTFYIDASTGNDGADGKTPQTAWLTLDKANGDAQPGDVFLLSGTFRGQLIHPAQSGTPGAKIVYRGMTGAAIDGGKYDVIVWLDGLAHVVVDNLELRNEAEPVVIRNGSNNIWLRNLHIHDAGSSGIHIRNASDNRIEDSRIERVGTEENNAGEGIFVQDGSHRNVIARNAVSFAGHGAVWIGYQASSEPTSADNVIERNDISNTWASAVGLNGKSKRTLLQCNRIHDTADGSGANYARAGIELEGDSNVVRYNEVFKSGAEGITLQGRTLFGFTQSATNNRIYNNTFWQNGRRVSDGSLESVQLIQMDAGNVRGNTIENNIFWHDHGFSYDNATYAMTVDLYHSSVPWTSGTGNGNVVRNNIFPKDQTLLLVINNLTPNQSYTVAHAQSTFPGWIGNLQADPLFVDEAAGDVRLQPGTPAAAMGAHCTANCIVQ
jgi:parallel beta helix pectate lyase-like protein